MREQLQNEGDNMLEMGVVGYNASPYPSPIIMVKKDGSNRVCLDFRKLNKITKLEPRACFSKPSENNHLKMVL